MALGYCQFGGRKETRWPWDNVSSADIDRQSGPGMLLVQLFYMSSYSHMTCRVDSSIWK